MHAHAKIIFEEWSMKRCTDGKTGKVLFLILAGLMIIAACRLAN
jgi:hypothetical protein